MFERILVAIDGSEYSSRAADAAIDLAKRSNASLFLITVIHNPVYAHSEVAAGDQQPVDKARTDAEAILKVAVSKAEAQGLKVRGEIVENVPSVVDAIADYAEEWKVELVVVGTRGLSGLKKILLGSVSAALLTRAPCSVLVVR
jgi:nucleotide-binding universal stress UspA family protein